MIDRTIYCTIIHPFVNNTVALASSAPNSRALRQDEIRLMCLLSQYVFETKRMAVSSKLLQEVKILLEQVTHKEQLLELAEKLPHEYSNLKELWRSSLIFKETEGNKETIGQKIMSIITGSIITINQFFGKYEKSLLV
ncbi:hypothetical protein BN1080_01696 [Planococcus massiliensis]|uniref:Uncharacterized protein n=1 Tax=Planococcus massiliensis TaxID=1499687 RepID=A0A098EN90_9BACL|nr:hypothetical protein [Planococcus massiliensis]CEG22761.1 hypothetical protein BN1080_01696 [Planococcus massiliensis]